MPSEISGSIQAPSSKSSMQRACAVALIAGGTTIIENAGTSNDENAALDIVKKLGASVDKVKKQIIITAPRTIFISPEKQKHLIVSCGESGLSLRMFVPIAALYNHDITFTGEGSILTRPINFFDEVLPKVNVSVSSNNGRLPITVSGPLKPRNITVDGSLSSQFLTGLLMAFARACITPVTVTVSNLTSKPYISLTLDILKYFGFRIENDDFRKFTVFPRTGGSEFSTKYTVEGDWSNTAFLLVAAAIGGEAMVTGVDMNSSQGDKKIINALEDCGATVRVDRSTVFVKKNKMSAFRFDATDCPDLFPPLVALAAYCSGTSEITGVERLKYKESNRGLTLKKEFAKMKVPLELDGNIMRITGGKEVRGASVSSHNDHRIAMACTVAGLNSKGNTQISQAEAVKKSYPGFYDDMKLMKANLTIS
ncbi:MAG: 3-phosphoshikimate 1-carboxyvinyltransferase [Ginsengibacter sp.]